MADASPVKALGLGERLVVKPVGENGETVPVPLMIRAHAGAELRITYRLGWDSHRDYLAVEYSQVAIAIAGLREVEGLGLGPPLGGVEPAIPV